uniref:Uncharacterized protein n=1 Tax=Plectus sambesii TaxID=2011161 RepID=A0A914XQ25_9BILA
MPVGLEEWFNNFTQMNYATLTHEQLAKIPKPLLELGIHVTCKTAEAAAVIGGLIIHPIYRFYLHKTLPDEKRTNNSSKIIRMACRKLQARVLFAGLALGPLLTVGYAKARRLTDDELRDRCYRLRFNRNQLYVDRMSIAFGFVGWYYLRWAGCVDGINIALGLTTVHNVIDKMGGSYPILADKYQHPPEGDELWKKKPVGAGIAASEKPDWWNSRTTHPPQNEQQSTTR